MQPVRYYRDLLSSFEIVPENVRGLKAIVTLKDEQTAVIIVEMPIPETYLDFFGQWRGGLPAIRKHSSGSRKRA
jgi:hypothetical protein